MGLLFRPFDRLAALDERDIEVERGFTLRLTAEVPADFFDGPRPNLCDRRCTCFGLQLTSTSDTRIVH